MTRRPQHYSIAEDGEQAGDNFFISLVAFLPCLDTIPDTLPRPPRVAPAGGCELSICESTQSAAFQTGGRQSRQTGAESGVQVVAGGSAAALSYIF